MGLRFSGSLRRRAAVLVAAAALVGGSAAALAAPGVAGAASPAPAARSTVVGGTALGPHVYLFTPDMAQADIQATVNDIAAQQLTNQFGTARYELLFAPGTYGSAANPLIFQVGYYTDVAGLGQSPGDVIINGSIDVYNQCDAGSCVALNNFWRSVSNLTINVAGGSGCQGNTEFWATSQAASMRRVAVNGAMTLMDYCTGPSYASGGFIADSSLSGTVVNGSQQQFVVRNSSLGSWTNGVWNQVFVGTKGAPAQSFGMSNANPYTTVAATPVEQEKPYLYLDSSNALRVFVPSARANTSGTTWADGPTPGTSLPLSRFFVATPADSSATINAALGKGMNLILTPGVYHVTSTLNVTHPGTVVLGLGLATLVPSNGVTTMNVAGRPGIKISDVIFDAGTVKSKNLLVLAAGSSSAGSPALLQDVYVRVGGATPGSVDTAVQIAASNVVIDNMWVWRADHGNGVGWTANTSATGLQVTGANVVAYGLFVEHFQGYEVRWNGPAGRIYMFQNEMPYDVPSQAAWMSSPTVKGYPAIAVGSLARGFMGYGLGSYSFFNQGVDIHATQAFSVAPGVNATVHDALTVCLDGMGGIDSVINGVGAPVSSASTGTPSNVVTYRH